MGFFKYTDDDITDQGADEILNKLEKSTKAEIDFMLYSSLLDCLTVIKDCESPIERMLGVGLYNAQAYWESLADSRGLNIYPQMDIVCGKKTYRADFQISAIVGGKEKILVVECDGHEFHEKTREQAVRDRQRERDLIKEGYIVVRFTGSEIYNNLYKCISEIRTILFGN